MSRWLVMAEHTITESERAVYLQALAVRRVRATAASVNFWVFEQHETRGRFLEFMEAGSQEALRAILYAETGEEKRVDAAAAARTMWREVRD